MQGTNLCVMTLVGSARFGRKVLWVVAAFLETTAAALRRVKQSKEAQNIWGATSKRKGLG